MSDESKSRTQAGGSAVDMRHFIADCRSLSAEEFEDRHGSAFLLLTASQLHIPKGPSATVVELGDIDETASSPTASLSLLVFAVKKTERSVGHLVTMGRASNNDVAIRDQSVSRFHAFMKQSDDDRFHIQDAGSTNGTMVNGTSVPARGHGPAVDLKTGDNLRLGQVELTFLAAEAFQSYGRQLEP
jgi:hypothetical protein